MTEMEWDDEVAKRIRKLFKVSNIKKMIVWKLVNDDRKHQKSEMLKRLPSPQEFMDFLLHLHEKSLRLRKPVTRKDEATAIHKLVKKKLKGK